MEYPVEYLEMYLRDINNAHQLVFDLRSDLSGRFYGIVFGTSFNTTNDENVKDQIEDVNLSPIFDGVNVKRYVRRDKHELGQRVGFLSQDIQRACSDSGLPNTFTSTMEQDDGSTLLTLDYSRLVTILWSKLKQVEARLAALESQ